MWDIQQIYMPLFYIYAEYFRLHFNILQNITIVIGYKKYSSIHDMKHVMTGCCVLHWYFQLLHLSVYTTHYVFTQFALHIPAGMGWTDVVVELVKNGANMNLQDQVCR